MTFLGQLIRIRPDPDKVKAVKSMQAPTDVSGIHCFLGVVNQLSKFIPNAAKLTRHLKELLIKDLSGCGGNHR